jgi:hypothetical protein
MDIRECICGDVTTNADGMCDDCKRLKELTDRNERPKKNIINY